MSEKEAFSASAEEIMTPNVIMLGIQATFREIIKTLCENKISAVFLHDPIKKDYYVVSERDIIEFLNEEDLSEKDIGKIPAAKIMKGPIDILDAKTSVDNMIRFMTEHKYKRVLISKSNKPVGVVSTSDIMIWNNFYFKPAKPQVLLFLDNLTSNFIGKYIFESNIDNEDISKDLIELYGGALKSISIITNEVIRKSGNIRHLIKDKRSILFESYKNITGILVCDHNSVELRRRLKEATKKFFEIHHKIIQNALDNKKGIHIMLDVSEIIPIFES